MRKPSTPGLLPATLLILALTAPLTAQITFQRTYGGTFNDEGWSVAQTADGGYVIAGYTYSFGGSRDDVYLIKTDANGDTIWTRTCGGADGNYGRSVAQTTDGGYVIAGYTESFGAGNWDVYLVKTDANGDTTWTRTYGDTVGDGGRSVVQTADGGYVIAGYTRSFGADEPDVWLIRTDASGNAIWTRTYGGADSDKGHSVAQTADGGYVITGTTWSFGAGSADLWLIKTDASGDTIWTRTFGGASFDGGYSVAQTADGGYVIAGYTKSFGAGYYDVYLVKTDASGDTIWTRTYGGTSWDMGYSVQQTTDGGYAIAGYTECFGAGNSDVYLIKTDSAGRVAITEPNPPVAFEPVGVTIVRGVLEISSQLTAGSLRPGIGLYDANGRRVAALHPGENDVRRLSPGVYFIRGKGSRDQGSEGPSRKVILTR